MAAFRLSVVMEPSLAESMYDRTFGSQVYAFTGALMATHSASSRVRASARSWPFWMESWYAFPMWRNFMGVGGYCGWLNFAGEAQKAVVF